MGTTGQSITLANSIIGVGILAMPFCFQQCGVLLATLILLSMGLVSRLCSHFLLKSALFARRRNFEFLAFHVFGPAGKMAVELGIIGFLMCTCIAYFVVVGDLGPQIIAKMFNINQSDILRTSIMVIVSLVCVLPLGLLRNVDSLSNVSAATIGFYFCLVIKVITEAASQLLTADWSAGLELWRPQGVLQCVPIFSMALFCQTQLFEIFESMPMLSLEKMNAVTKNAINTCTAVYFTLGVFGYIAFSKQEISGNILMSLSPTMTSDVIKLGFVMSLAFSFPLIIFPCRASLYSFLYKKVHHSQHDHIINHSIPEGAFRGMTVGIVGSALVVSLLVPTIELVLGLAGSTIGVLVCVIFPAACFLRLTTKNTNERVLAKVVLVLGLVILVLGTYANLQAAESRDGKYDDKRITQDRIDRMVEDFFHSKQMENGGAAMKPPPKSKEPISKEVIKEKEADLLDSEVQPPNPVPPESKPNDKNDSPKPDKPQLENKKILKEQEINADIDKVSETHPKNLKKITNGEVKREEIVESQKVDDVKEKINKQKIDLIKQAQLMETIKEHGEEQKALMKEQHEILENIMKTKQELQKKHNEAKKIAVESIQKIANVAIQSLSAVSEEPSDNVLKKDQSDNANEAVKKIADVAVEAIKELKNQPQSESIIANELNAAPVPVNKEVNQNEPRLQNDIPPVQSVNNIASAIIKEAAEKNVESKVVNNEPKPVINNVLVANNPPIVNAPLANAPVINNGPVANIAPIENNIPIANNVAPVANNVPLSNNAPINNNFPVVNNVPAANNVPMVNNAPVSNNVPMTNNVPAENNAPMANNVPAANNVPIVNNAPVANNVPMTNNVPAENNAPMANNVPIVNNAPVANIVPAQSNVPMTNNFPVANNVPATNNVPVVNNAPVANIIPVQSNVPITNNAPVANNVPAANNFLVVNNAPVANNVPMTNNVPAENNVPMANNVPVVNNVPIANAPMMNNIPDPRPVSNVASNKIDTIPETPIRSNIAQEKQLGEQIKEHSHMPDEPQSYKQGEDAQRKPRVNTNILNSVPLPIAMNENLKSAEIKQEMVKNPEIHDDKSINNLQVNDALPRQKREVVDCTNKQSLRVEDREICKSLVNTQEKDKQEILPNVDLNDALSKGLPLVDMNVVHHMRSLKSYNEEKRR